MSSIEGVREKFFTYLMKKVLTSKQAEQYLRRTQLDDDRVREIMLEAESMGLVDDEAYARIYSGGHEGYGNAKITYELEQRGIDKETIELALEELPDEAERAKELYESWVKLLEEKKIISRLLRRGFTSRTVNSIVKNKYDVGY